MGLQSLERRLERMVDGVFRGSRAAIRPIELGRRLVREMDDHRSVDVKGRRVVPNDFTIQLSPRDLAGFADIEDVLQAELVEAAREYAREEGYHFMGPVRVDLRADDDARPGRFNVVVHAAPGRRRRRRRRRSCCRRASGSRSATGPSRSAGCRECTIPINDRTSAAATPRSVPAAAPTSSPTSARRTARWSTASASPASSALDRRRHRQLRLHLRPVRGVLARRADTSVHMTDQASTSSSSSCWACCTSSSPASCGRCGARCAAPTAG